MFFKGESLHPLILNWSKQTTTKEKLSINSSKEGLVKYQIMFSNGKIETLSLIRYFINNPVIKSIKLSNKTKTHKFVVSVTRIFPTVLKAVRRRWGVGQGR